MLGQFADLSEDERALAAGRARADYIINCALQWIGRFHSEFPRQLIMELLDGVRHLSKVMQGRSASEIAEAITSLLNAQTRLLLPGSGVAPTAPNRSGHVASASQAPPRAHTQWAEDQGNSSAGTPHRPTANETGPVFVSYARADSNWLARLLVHLRPLERSGRIELWHDGKLMVGKPWRVELDRALMRASAAILVVTANFMASDFIVTQELPSIAKRATKEGIPVFPVVFGHCLFEEDPHLCELQLFNDPEKPLSRMDSSEADAVLVKLAKALRSIA